MISKTISMFLAVILLVFNIGGQSSSKASSPMLEEKGNPCAYVSFSDATNVLGGPVRLIEKSWNFSDEGQKLNCTYYRLERDSASRKEVALYFMIEESQTESLAKEVYQRILSSNKDHEGVEEFPGVGNEAYTHSDKKNFHFVMARKDRFTVRLKVNKVSENVSFSELKMLAQRVAEKL